MFPVMLPTIKKLGWAVVLRTTPNTFTTLPIFPYLTLPLFATIADFFRQFSQPPRQLFFTRPTQFSTVLQTFRRESLEMYSRPVPGRHIESFLPVPVSPPNFFRSDITFEGSRGSISLLLSSFFRNLPSVSSFFRPTSSHSTHAEMQIRHREGPLRLSTFFSPWFLFFQPYQARFLRGEEGLLSHPLGTPQDLCAFSPVNGPNFIASSRPSVSIS